MTVKIGINGFGRIGRLAFRRILALQGETDIQVVAINDLTSPAMLAHLLKYDSTYGVLPEEVSATDHALIVGGQSFTVYAEPDAVMAAISAGTMLTLSLVNRTLSDRTKSASPAASARDFLSDALTSTGTMLAIIVASAWHIYWIDPLAAIILGGFIIYNGSRILSNSAAKLSNGFSPAIRQAITATIESANEVQAVTFVDGRYSGSNIIVAAEIVLAAQTTVPEAYRICQHVQLLLQIQFPILYCCIQVKPASAQHTLHP
ncbi:MAG: glyceraldehyde 3-phosphate dehydrogenase NAD-binding domain-containing protein [Schleiferilactobacillus perolens]|uniref:glyceraldehyde 3-phosphate dehydrogenase NAD-binding domain-containing protein n=1 Tax=Schleiferilactobacillus perolens TaxID=100468 RepID=UPI0039EA1168